MPQPIQVEEYESPRDQPGIDDRITSGLLIVAVVYLAGQVLRWLLS